MIQHDIRLAIAAMPISLEQKYSGLTKQLYAPLLASAGEGVSEQLDVAYGPHERHRLDVFHVAGSRPSAIVIYAPGGGFVGGSKRSDDLVFANVGRYFARRGMLGITMNYRIAPEFPWPAGAQDIGAAVAWAKANAASYGADAGKVVLVGHSAGASHCATYLFDPELRGDGQVAGAALVSGGSYTVQADEIASRPNVAAYYGSDPATFARRSSVNHVAGTKVPVLLAFAERDPGFQVLPTLEMAIAITKRDGLCPEILRLEGHNHFSMPCSFATSDDQLGGAMVRFIGGLGR